ncbi:MAG TPA: LysM peptidoglycan-binding domain-containing protein [Acidimicrobiales bacterium]|nr:LysM peptidoglycan-binding domain-containing protein [Acidimicrobiales bacterium]
MTDRPFPRLRRTLSAAVTLLAVLIIVPSVPVVLAIVVGLPIPRPFDASTVFAERGLFDLVVVIVWVLWAIHLVLLIRATVTQLRHDHPDPRTPHYINRLAVRIAGACMAVAAVVAGTSLSAGAAPTSTVAVAAPAPPNATPTTSSSAASTAPTPAVASPSVPPVTPASTASTYTVEEGQSLWIIAEQLYGDGENWQLLWQANAGRTMDDGLVFTDPNLIYAGWQLSVPSTTSDPPPATPAPSETVAPVTAPSDPQPATPDPPPAASATAPGPTSTPTTTAPHDQAPSRQGAPANDSTVPARHVAAHPSVRRHADDPHRYELPELAALGLGALCAALLAAAALRSRRLARRHRLPGQTTRARTERAESIEADLAAFTAVPLPDLVGYGFSHLTFALAGQEHTAPRIRLVRVGPDGLTLVLAEPTTEAPGAFLSGADGYAWVLPAAVEVTTLPGAHDTEPWIAALVPAGESAAGTFLVPVEPGAVVPLVGTNAPSVLAAMRTVAQAWAWTGDRLHVVTTPEAAREALALLGNPTFLEERGRVLYLGDPEALDPSTRAQVGTVTTEAASATDVTVVCDPTVTTIQPFGLSLLPAAVDDDMARALDELAVPPEVVDEQQPSEARRTSAGDAGGETTPAAFPEPAPVEVRVLTPVPRIEGATGTAPEHREARAIELLAYLALHGHAIPPYEIRAETLATRTGEGSAHTMRLVAAALRQWVGAEHLPHADRAGGYQSLDVSTDFGRLQAAVQRADAVSDPDALVALLRPALDLIEGAPASRVGMGWGWWGPQFEALAANAATDAAHLLAPLLAERGDGRGARWAIDQARRLDPFNESLFRLAIECASRVGNAAWIDRELQACEAMIEDLYPGASPTAKTYDAYHVAMAQFSVRPGPTGDG